MTKFQYYRARLKLLVIRMGIASMISATMRYICIRRLLNMAADLTDSNDEYTVKLWRDIMRVVNKQLQKEVKRKK